MIGVQMAKANNNEILAYALNHLEKERDDLQAKIDHIRQQLGIRSVAAAPEAAAPARAGKAKVVKRVLSASARKRIAAAQKRRWAAHRKAKKAAAKSA